MSGAHGFGSTDGGQTWKPIKVDANGRLVLDKSLLFDDTPVDGETSKGITSNWAYDHKADASAHHARYTDAESRAAINNILDADGYLTGNLNCQYYGVSYLKTFTMKYQGDSDYLLNVICASNAARLRLYATKTGVGYVPVAFQLYDGTAYRGVCTEIVADGKISDHAGVADAHHARYTDAEAQAACNLDGTLYWSAPGCAFKALNPDADDIYFDTNTGVLIASADGITLFCPVNLPDGATITGAVVYGNASAEAETWQLRRTELSSGAGGQMATANIGTEDTSITNPGVDNSAYSYYIATSSIDTNDVIYGVRITFTL